MTLPARPQDMIVSDGLLLVRSGPPPADGQERAETFLSLFAEMLPFVTPSGPTKTVPQTDWAAVAEKSGKDLLGPAAGVMVPAKNENGTTDSDHSTMVRLLRAYYNDSRAGVAELVTQLDVLEPLQRWDSGSVLARSLTTSLEQVSFYHKEIGSVADALASDVFVPGAMLDGWYQMSLLAKLSDMASPPRNSGWARALFFSSIDNTIKLAHAFDYVWPVTYDPLARKKGRGTERSDAYGYLYLMMQAYILSGNNTFLDEAKAVRSTHGALHRQEFFSLYERPFLELGALGLMKLAEVTGDPTAAREAMRPLAYTLPSIALFQADHGFRAAVPTFMQVSGYGDLLGYRECFYTIAI